MSQRYDIAIVGGAMAGATLALALAAQRRPDGGRWTIALVEAKDPRAEQHPGYDSRAIALAAGSVQRLQSLELWSAIAPHAQAITGIQVSDAGHFGGVAMAAEEYGVDALGQVVELERIGPALWQRVDGCHNITPFCPDGLASLAQQLDSVKLGLTSGASIEAKLVVGADGTFSRVREHLGLALQREPYNQTALIANISSELNPGLAFERFTAGGPLALLPMCDQRYSLVWVQSPQDAERRLQLSERDFLTELQTAFGYRLGTLTKVGQRASYPLGLCQAERISHHRAVLVGNAAQTVHPIAGQGFNLGLRDVDTLARQLDAVLQQAGDPGAFHTLADYQEARQPDRDRICTLTDGLVRLFSNASRPVALGRNLGLAAMAMSDNFKAGLANTAMGWPRAGERASRT